MKTKYLLVLGAGATLSDAEKCSIKQRPPLDRGFFVSTKKVNYNEFKIVNDYLQATYGYQSTDGGYDSLEAVMVSIYADIHNPHLEKNAVSAFRALIRLFCRRLADSTNDLNPTNRSNLYRLIAKLLDDGVKPEEICIITFNQDLQIEKALYKLEQTKRSLWAGTIFNFPYCYRIQNAPDLLSKPPAKITVFPIGNNNVEAVRVLKLHGSLNWYSSHKTKEVPKNAILNTSRAFHITQRNKIATDMTFAVKRKQYAFPLITPPVNHKAGIMHQQIIPLWTEAETALKHAQHVIVFGYSCPSADSESANLFMRSLRANNNLKMFNVIDPNPSVLQRYAQITGLNKISYYRFMKSFLQ